VPRIEAQVRCSARVLARHKVDSDISAASNSRNRAIRKKISSMVIDRQVRSIPSGRTVPSMSGRVRS
jgi:hypothetical protein